MEDLIMKIIDIEDRAQEIIRDAKKADKELEKRIQGETVRLRSDIEKRLEAKNAALKQFETEDAETKIVKIEANAEANLNTLEEKYTANKDKWVNQIVDNIIGR